MSLLMEALRKAEEAKRRTQQQDELAAGTRATADTQPAPRSAGTGTTAQPAGLTLEAREPEITPEYILDNFVADQDPAPAIARDVYRADKRRDTFEDGDAHADPYPARPDPHPPAAAERVSPRTLARSRKTAAASVFAAKQNPARSRKTMTILVVVMVLMLPIGGGTLWYLQSMTPPGIGINPSVANYDLASRGFLGEDSSAAPVTTPAVPPGTAAVVTDGENLAPTATAAETAPVAENLTETPVETPAEIITTETAPESLPEPAVTSVPVIATAFTPPVAVLPPGAAAVPVVEAPATSVSAPAAVLEVSRSGGVRTVNPDLVIAYERLQNGDFLVAGQLYQEVLNGMPNNRDALLGLALARLRQGEPAQARELYARLLQLNPRDPMAHAGLLQTMPVIDPAEHEAALKSLLAEYPEVAPLQMALGNLYASQQRWSEAQGAYYNALLNASRSTDGPVHPDYAFNLAVSLEQLNQKKAALDYYRQARKLALEVTPGFDPQLLNSRLAFLEQNQP